MNYLTNVIIWTLAMYGLYEIIKSIIYYIFSYRGENTYFIVLTRNGNNKKIQSAKLVDWEECKK